jgi:cytochrome c oxidase subunit 4
MGAGHHIVPIATYRKVLYVLLGLTALTVVFAPTVSGLHLGFFSTVIAFGIAATKAVLVAAIFMHLKYDNKLNTVIIASSLFFLILLFAISAFDFYTRFAITDPI